jgi:hypothetical protein
VEARRAHSSRIERVPLMTTATRPDFALAGRPTTERASYVRAGGVEALLLIRLSIQNNRRFARVIRDGAHAQILWLSSDEWWSVAVSAKTLSFLPTSCLQVAAASGANGWTTDFTTNQAIRGIILVVSRQESVPNALTVQDAIFQATGTKPVVRVEHIGNTEPDVIFVAVAQSPYPSEDFPTRLQGPTRKNSVPFPCRSHRTTPKTKYYMPSAPL